VKPASSLRAADSRSFPSGSGFTLIEALMVIVILSAAGVAVLAPLLVSAGGTGPNGPAVQVQMAAMLQGQAEVVSSELWGLSSDEWKQRLLSLSRSSPIRVSEDTILNGVPFQLSRSYACVAEDLSTPDPVCESGLTIVTVSVNAGDSNAGELSFLKSREGM